MICPHCKYEHGWNYEKEENVIGNSGTFFMLPIEMTKKDPWEEIEREYLYACPSCGISFINTRGE